jgi:diguanylate cyclase (GGDEF)-like protein
VLLIGFLLLGLIFAYALARTLTGLHSQVAEQAVTDELTGLENRRRMQQRLADEGARAQRFGHQISALIIDIDDFKQINDERGHQQGDEVLRTIARIVSDSTRAIDIAARFGGDELALVLLETDAEGAMVLAERLRTQVSETEIELRNGESIHVTVSIGAATVPDSAESVEELIEAADQALLTVKRSGKDQVASAPKLRKRKVTAR